MTTGASDLAVLVVALAATWRFVPPSSKGLHAAFESDRHWSEVSRHAAHIARTPVEVVEGAVAAADPKFASSARPTANFAKCLDTLRINVLASAKERKSSVAGICLVKPTNWHVAVRVLGRHLLLAAIAPQRVQAVDALTRPLALPAFGEWDAHLHDTSAATGDADTLWEGLMRGTAHVDNDRDRQGVAQVRLARSVKLASEARKLRSLITRGSEDYCEVCLLRELVLAHLSSCKSGACLTSCEHCLVAVAYVQTRSMWFELVHNRRQVTGLAEFAQNFALARSLRKAAQATATDSADLRVGVLLASGRADSNARTFYAPTRAPPLLRLVGSPEAMLKTMDKAKAAADQLCKCTTPPAGIDVVSREIGWHPLLWEPFFAAAGERNLIVAMHIGEDMADLLTGVRVVSDGLALLRRHTQRRECRRLGHALAIRVDVVAWYAKQGQARPSLWEHAQDLMWAWGQVQTRQVALRAELKQRWTATRMRLGGCVAKLKLASAAQLYMAQKPLCACYNCCPGAPAHLTRPPCTGAVEVGQDAHMAVFLPNRAWLELVNHCQLRVRGEVARYAYVEVCPTSNAEISGLGWSFALDMGTGSNFAKDLRVRIGSDDPGLLATSLPLERALLRQWLLLCGKTAHAADGWLRTAFTRL